MRVLAVTEEFPYPPDTGWKLRTWNLLSRLAGAHEITVVCHADPAEAEAVEVLCERGFRVAPVWRRRRVKAGPRFYASLLWNLAGPRPYLVSAHCSSALRNRVAKLLTSQRFDVVHCDWTPLMANVPYAARDRTVVTAHNVETEIWRRYLCIEKNPARSWYISRQLQKLVGFEGEAFRLAGLVVAVSGRDAELIRSWFGCERVQVVCNGVDLDYFRPAAGSERDGQLLYAGSMDTIANADAARWTVSEVLPLVAQEHPEVSLDIVGRNPTLAVKSLARQGPVRVTGSVEDVRPYYSAAQVVVVPLRVGGGTRLKILEAWAMGKAVVSTSVGCEGLRARHGRNLLIANDAPAFAQAIVRLLEDPIGRRSLGEAGRQTAAAHYDWDVVASGLAEAWEEVRLKAGPACRVL
jgi:sugar transferase (PEP-CTERM/EpsH1 system associated)